ncbi:alpha/beta hydrolase [Flagellatimonas centrodinii]|uniref:alpha/beta hydrolase n=1 Tax=Flagellatimonas centrodinii TaxID=2806210 RepID=UPI001FEDDFBD|nr:alpha/beta hydrolase [Flagellatimonas centrodinii]ULQ47160.1 alpha/beta hydrolase [Flagellatimonas centrodinii]
MRGYRQLLMAGVLSWVATGAHAGDVEQRQFRAADNQTWLQARIHRPPGEAPAAGWPTVLVLHGGGWRGGEPAQMDPVGEQLAAAGLMSVSVGYRLAPEAQWPAQREDARAALAWLRDPTNTLGADPARIGAWGYSAGAHLAALVGATAEVRAVVAGGLPADLTRYPRSPLIRDLMGTRLTTDSQGWHAASPVFQVTPQSAPMYLYHAAWDWVVGADNARQMQAALARAGVSVSLRMVPFRGHIAAFYWDGGAEAEGIAFLKRQLSPPPPA